MAALLLFGTLALISATLVARRDATPAATAASTTAPPPATSAVDPADLSIVVRARRADDLDAVTNLALALGYRVMSRAEQPPAINVARPTGVSIARAITDFSSKPGVLYAEPAYPMRVSDTPTDPLYADESYLKVVRAPEAWDIETGEPGIIVGVLDTGLDVGHPDLAGRVWTNVREIPGNGVDDDNNGCVDDVNGCAFVQAPEGNCGAPVSGDVHDDLGHGTFVSGIIAANANGKGMVGVARGVTIMPVKVLDCTGGGFSFSLAQGILYAAQNGAKVLNVSLGGPVDSAYIKEAIRIARVDYGVLLVAATGNDPSSIQYPARYDTTLAVGATSDTDPTQRAPFSPAGPEVDVVAVGEGIVGTVPRGTCAAFLPCTGDDGLYAVGSGTSFAAPQVTGLVALMLSRNPYLGPDQIESVIKNSADPLPAGVTPGWAGAGRINMLRAVKPAFSLGIPGTARN